RTLGNGYAARVRLKMDDGRLNKWDSDELNEAYIMLEQSTSLVFDWEWKLTAADFFQVDVQVLTGVLAAMMSYTIFLFQL
ncbi:unnamed protein product, partial [Allacma fusca]